MSLELRIPPVLVFLLCIGLAYGLSFIRMGTLRGSYDFLTPLFFLAGFGIAVAGILAFRKAQTTIDPTKPQESSQLVTSGIYRFTRNPMYLGLALVLLGWIVQMGMGISFSALVVFVWFISKYQIMPEETILKERFGEPYTKYCQQVRRWI